MRVTVFGASGPTGRQLTGQALDGGHEVVAVTRRPERVPARMGLTVAHADVTDASAVAATVAGSDAVVSATGVPYTAKPVSVYSAGAANIIAAMASHGVWRLVVAGTEALDPGAAELSMINARPAPDNSKKRPAPCAAPLAQITARSVPRPPRPAPPASRPRVPRRGVGATMRDAAMVPTA